MIRLAVRVAREHAEAALAELLELAPGGLEEREVSDAVVEYAIYGAPGELPSLPALRAAVGGALVEVATSELADDWAERWREFHRPLVLPGELAVRAPWHPPQGEPVEVVIDPGQAFGTGAHATTRLCLELLLELPRGPLPVLDLGCGSGVLAITAAKLGFSPVLALDNDPAAVRAARANARRNDVSIAARGHDLRKQPPAAARIVLANLLAPLLVLWARRLAGRSSTARPACVIAGGLLVGECDAVTRAFAPLGLAERERRSAGEWAALLLAAY